MATLQPGQVTQAGQIGAAGGTAVIDLTNGRLTHPDNPNYLRTNEGTVTGTGPETPFGVLGGTIADQRVRGIVDTRNATNVGVTAGPDAEAPRVYEP